MNSKEYPQTREEMRNGTLFFSVDGPCHEHCHGVDGRNHRIPIFNIWLDNANKFFFRAKTDVVRELNLIARKCLQHPDA